MSNPSARKRRRRGGASSTASVEDAAAALHENTAAFLDSGAGDPQAIAASIAAAGVSPDQLDQEGEAPTFVEGLHLELVPPSKCKWAVLPAASLTICTTAATRAYSHIPGKFYVLSLKVWSYSCVCVCVEHGAVVADPHVARDQDASGKVIRLNGSQGAYMDFYQDDPQTGVHFVTRLKSPGGYASDGYHYFNAHTYLVPGKFTIKFGLSRRSTMHFGRVPAVAYTTVVRDPGTPRYKVYVCYPMHDGPPLRQSWKKLNVRWLESPRCSAKSCCPAICATFDHSSLRSCQARNNCKTSKSTLTRMLNRSRYRLTETPWCRSVCPYTSPWSAGLHHRVAGRRRGTSALHAHWMRARVDQPYSLNTHALYRVAEGGSDDEGTQPAP